MFAFRKSILLFLLVIITSCSDIESCYYAEDFGDVGNRDQFYVAAQSLSCNYNSSLEVSSPIQSVDIVDCLNNTTVSTANSECSSNEECNKVSNEKCYNIDPITNSSYSTSVFQNCVSYCSNLCESNSSNVGESYWTKATLRTSNTYFGLTIDGTSYITVQATGKISLSEAVKSKSSVYKKIGVNETDYSLVIKPTDTYELTLQYSNDILPTLLSDIIDNIKTRTILSIKNLESSIIDSRDGITSIEKYKFQEPLFQYISCSNVKTKNDFGINESGGCSLNYLNDSNITNDLKSSLNSYYNDINTILFKNGTYYLYAADILNNVNYMAQNTNDSSYSPVFEKKDLSGPNLLKLSQDGMKILYDNTSESVAAYIWNNNNSNFYINYNEPFKVAIRYIGNTATTCNYTASIDNYYDIESQGDKKSVVSKTKTYNIDNLEFSAAGKEEGNKNTWYVLKTKIGTGDEYREIVFNQFSNAKNEQTSTFTLTTNDENCNKGLLIYIIPLKDYTPYDTGLLYFYLPGSNNFTQNISYSIINPEILNIDSTSLDRQEIKLEEYYDDTKNYNAFGLIDTNNYEYKQIPIITTSDVLNIDDNNYNSILNKSAFIRDNQLIRFDYTNWFDIDGRTSISKKSTNYSGDTGNIIVDVATIFNVIIKNKYPFICFGEAEENIGISSYCSKNNLTFEQVTISEQCSASTINDFKSLPSNCSDVNDNEGFCSITNNIISKCYVGDFKPTGSDKTLADFYVDLTYSNLTTSDSNYNSLKESLKQDIKEKTVASFVNDVVFSVGSSLYDNDIEGTYDIDGEKVTINKGTNTADNEKIINYAYELSRQCFSTLIGEKDNIVIVKDNISGDDTFKLLYDISKITNINTLLPNQITTKEKFNKMVDLFLTKTVNNIQNGSENISYSNTFNIYKKINESDLLTNKTQCYDLTDFVGSTKQFILNTQNNKDIVDISNYGNASKDYITLGISKIPNFSINSAGNISNLKADTEFDNWHNDLNCNGNCIALNYDGQISSSTQYTLSLNILNKLTTDQINSYDTQFINYFTYTNTDSVLFATNNSIKEYNSNGDRLSVILGEDSMNYIGDIKDDFNNDIKAYNSTSGELTITKFDNNSITSNLTYYPLVYYPEKITTESSYYFNDEGLLTDRNNISAIDVKNNQLVNKYITMDSIQKNIFFKISDTDDNVSNNSGKYSITIKEYVENDYDSMIDMFRLFFQSVLSFIDGNSISLLSIGDSSEEIVDRLVKCEEQENNLEVSCHVYDPGSENNGKMCSPKDINCFIDCLGQSDGACFKFNDGNGFVKMVYKTIITNPLYILLLKIALILSIALYGFGYFFGLTSFKQSEIIEKIIKLCFVYFMASASGWEFFDKFIATFFKNGVDSILFLIASSFETNLSSEVMRAVSTKNYSDKIVLFSGAMDNLELLISMPVFSKIVGLFFSGWIGPVYFYFVITTLLTYIVAVISSIIIYLSIQVYMSLVFCFFPLVIIFMLFKKSEDTFKNWLNLLIGFAGQQILLITTLSFFNMLIYNFIKNTFAYTVCWLPLLDIKLGGFPVGLISFYKIPNTGVSTLGINAGNEAMPSFYSIITFYMIGALMGKFISSMTSLGGSIFGSKFDVAGKGSLAGKAIDTVKGLKTQADDFMKKTGGEFYGKMGRLAGGSFIEREGNKKLQERRKKESDFKKELDSKTAEALADKKGTDEYKKKENNITNMARNKATAQEFAKDKDFMDKYNKALNGKEDDGTNEEANKLVKEKLSSNNTTDAQRNSIAKKANGIKKSEMNELNRQMEEETRREVSEKMLTEVDKEGKPTRFNLVNQLSYNDSEKQRMSDAFLNMGEENRKKIANEVAYNSGNIKSRSDYSETKNDKPDSESSIKEEKEEPSNDGSDIKDSHKDLDVDDNQEEEHVDHNDNDPDEKQTSKNK